ncbi:DNA repair protein RecN [Parvibacter caecicola]|uniref:DNA repair protein RecN n=1 Tax=Parvibacter caecicola TaxID=747645 RepID=A0A4T9T9R4_9ACTN|nr:AAA family ATPase [Parvibacter caecicola]TJW12295.1 DNA repair protein RecN [Parvibacter caecicola]
MIDELQVSNIALIREATLAPSPRFTVLTGETGAGKTALLSACRLLMGARADKTLVREGAESATAAGRFFRGDEETVVIRRLSADGRSRVSVNGHMAAVGELAQLVAPAIDLCGQHDQQQLTDVARHQALFDGWAHEELAEALQGYEHAWEQRQQAQAALSRLTSAAQQSEAAIAQARADRDRIEAVDPLDDEYDDLLGRTQRAEHAEALMAAAQAAHGALAEEGGALDALNSAIFALDGAAAADGALADFAKPLKEAVFLAEDAARDIARYREDLDFNPEEMALLQSRLQELQALMRLFGPTLADVNMRRREAQQLLESIDCSDELVEKAKLQLNAANSALSEAGRVLSAARHGQKGTFERQINDVLEQLEMKGAQLECQMVPLPFEQWTANGPDAIEFLFSPGKSLTPRPLARIASGGELSRVMLALKVVMGQADPVETLVFDEIDAGVGGATAHALGRLLAQLAETHQVIVVTHLAQVAAFADTHYVVEKTDGDAPETLMRPVTDAARIQEVARLLSGSHTATSLAHAEELLASAQQER